MRKINHYQEQLGKLPPQSLDLEKGVIGQCLTQESNREYVTFLKPEHFYKEDHQIIWKAIAMVSFPNLKTVSQYLKSTGNLEKIGGAYTLTQLSNQYMNPAQMEYSGRIIQQMFIKREMIRISGDTIKGAYDDSVDCIQLFDEFYKNISEMEKIFDNGTHGEISSAENEFEYMENSRNGIVQNGLSTGFNHLDGYFRFKPSSLVICNGHDNVGKTAVLLYLAVISNRLHGID